ncbi:hypothetical protein OSTOST_12658 [Ostertagia ostertagi]
MTFGTITNQLYTERLTRGPAVSVHDKPQFLLAFLSVLGVKQVMVVTASMAAQYVLPLLTQDVFVCVVGIAPSNTHEISQPSLYRTPILVLWGKFREVTSKMGKYTY